MKDEEITGKLAEVEDIIDRLNRGDISLEKGKELKQRAEDLLDELEAALNQGDGETVVIQMEGDEIAKEELQI